MRTARSTALLVLLIAVAGLAQQPAPVHAVITSERLRADLFFLASDPMRGRLTGTEGNELAARWIRSRFERAGLRPAADGSYFQPFDLMTATLGATNRLAITGRARSALPASFGVGKDFYPLRFSPSAEARGGVTFVGYGIAAPALAHDDLPADAVRGRILLMLEHEPDERDLHSPFDGVVTSEYGVALKKTLAAQARGAAGVLFVNDVHNHANPPDFAGAAAGYWPVDAPRVERYLLNRWAERVRIPAVEISPALAEGLLRGTGRSLSDLGRAADDAPGGFTPLPLADVAIDLATAVDRRVLSDRNVIAAIDGADPVLKDEWVIICAHLDHEGADGTRIYNGADDDGSGVVALLSIADAFAEDARQGRRPRRSVLFAAWDSEERGLLGSWAFTESPTMRLDRVAAALNMDMIGRNEEVPPDGGNRFAGLEVQTAESNANAVNVVGTARSADLKAVAERANAAIGLTLRLRYDNNASQLMRRSDHWPFLQHGVPALWLHTGLHPDYHTERDTPEKVNYDKLEKIARLAYQMTWDLANQAERPRLNPTGMRGTR
jgi:hypothetical protein